jgi:hypothetical protein
VSDCSGSSSPTLLITSRLSIVMLNLLSESIMGRAPLTEVALGGGLNEGGRPRSRNSRNGRRSKRERNTSTSLWSDQVSDDHKPRQATNFVRQVKLDVIFHSTEGLGNCSSCVLVSIVVLCCAVVIEC